MGGNPTTRRLIPRRVLRSAWTTGGRIERLFVVLALLILPLILAPFGFLATAGLPYDEFRQIGGAWFMAMLSFYFYQQPIYGAMYGAAFFRAAADRQWGTTREVAFYSVLAKYQQERGVKGHLPGEVMRGLAFYILYIGMVWLSVVLGLALYPLVQDYFFPVFVSVNAPLTLGLWYLDGRRRHRQFERAQSEGFPLIDLEPWKIRLKRRKGSRNTFEEKE